MATRVFIRMITLDINLPLAMTAEEQKELFDCWMEDSWKELAKKNVRLAIVLANRWQGRGLGDDELLSAAMYGLTKAARNFRPDKGIQFSTYASKVIQNEFLMAMRKEKRWAHLASLDEPVTFVKSGSEVRIIDTIASRDDCFEDVFNEIERQELRKAVDMLGDEERRLVMLYLAGWKQKEIAAKIGSSQSLVSRKLKKVFAKLRRHLERMT